MLMYNFLVVDYYVKTANCSMLNNYNAVRPGTIYLFAGHWVLGLPYCLQIVISITCRNFI